MIIFVNTQAGGGTAGKKWKKLVTVQPSSIFRPNAVLTHGRALTESAVRQALDDGEREFVAAGGDGTVNMLLNTLLALCGPGEVESLRLGAIGIGSSNDFHKPFTERSITEGIPTRLDFSSASPRDVGCVTYQQSGKLLTRHFLINASIGVAAEANHLFNHPDRLLRLIKRYHTGSAILYAALKTIAGFENTAFEISTPETGTFCTRVANLGITKSPHFSGDFSYGGPLSPDNGRFTVYLCRDLSRTELVALLRKLGTGIFAATEKTYSWKTSSIRLASERPFPVEYDGEIITTTSATFTILPRYLRVCTC